MKESFPANTAREVGQIVEERSEEIENVGSLDFRGLRVGRPAEVDEYGLPLDMCLVEKSPEARVLAVITIIAQHEILIGRHLHRSEMIAG